MKLSQLLAKALEENFVVNGQDDYARMANLFTSNGVRPVNAHVWKVLDALKKTANEAEDDL